MKNKFSVEYYQRVRKNVLRPLDANFRRYVLFPNDNAVTASLIEGWNYEEYMFHFINDNMLDLEGTDVIDIGANNGNFTIEFAELVGDNGKVYAFEPQRIIFQQLCGNVFLNGLDNVYTYNVPKTTDHQPLLIRECCRNQNNFFLLHVCMYAFMYAHVQEH